jgi:diguanylate cyclase (GGDEF)-like protein
VNEPLLIDRVADTTSHRDRIALDSAIVHLLVEFLNARAVNLYQLLDDPPHKRLLRRAGFADGMILGPQRSEELATLPTLASRGQWRACVEGKQIVHSMAAEGRPASYFPVEERSGVVGLLEIELREALPARDAGLVGGILRILKNQTALLDYGERDTLTGLLNRKTFETRFERICRELRAAPQPVQSQGWLGLLDIDRFKSINDTHGHIFGDEVLLLVSQIMQRTLRGADRLFRFGGEEFVLVLEGIELNGAQVAFERIRAAIASYQFPQVGRVTASLGYTRIQRQDVPATCIERADAALYYVKRNGRNGIRCFDLLVEAGHLEAKNASGEIELF